MKKNLKCNCGAPCEGGYCTTDGRRVFAICGNCHGIRYEVNTEEELTKVKESGNNG